MLKRLSLAVAVSVMVLSFTGCVGLMGAGGATTTTAGIYTAMNLPSEYSPSTVHQFNASDFEILNRVESMGETKNILGIIATGNAGYHGLLAKCREAGGDALIDVYMDVDYMNILGVYGVAKYNLYGTPIQYKR